MLLCDAAQAVEGKLYILGGGWNTIGPDPAPTAIAMYTNAVGELAETGDPDVAPLAWELLTLRAEMIGALTQAGPSRENGAGAHY